MVMQKSVRWDRNRGTFYKNIKETAFKLHEKSGTPVEYIDGFLVRTAYNQALRRFHIALKSAKKHINHESNIRVANNYVSTSNLVPTPLALQVVGQHLKNLKAANFSRVRRYCMKNHPELISTSNSVLSVFNNKESFDNHQKEIVELNHKLKAKSGTVTVLLNSHLLQAMEVLSDYHLNNSLKGKLGNIRKMLNKEFILNEKNEKRKRDLQKSFFKDSKKEHKIN
ncbi:Uncharacterised protein [uncultured archaeon]|nr:Uncharacterised protein [uncultured archaeon]